MYQIQKKRRSIWWVLALFLCAFIVGISIGYVSVRMNRQGQETEDVPNLSGELILPEKPEAEIPDRTASIILNPEEQSRPPEETYYVTAQGNKVSVFKIDEKGNRQFSHNLAIELDALREEDKQLFYEGIMVYSKQELSSLVEDFGS